MPLKPTAHRPTAPKAKPPRSGSAAQMKADGKVTSRTGGDALGTLMDDKASAGRSTVGDPGTGPFPNITPFGK